MIQVAKMADRSGAHARNMVAAAPAASSFAMCVDMSYSTLDFRGRSPAGAHQLAVTSYVVAPLLLY